MSTAGVCLFCLHIWLSPLVPEKGEGSFFSPSLRVLQFLCWFQVVHREIFLHVCRLERVPVGAFSLVSLIFTWVQLTQCS